MTSGRVSPGNHAWAQAGRPGPDSPEVAFVAAQPLSPGDTDAVLELRRLADGRLAVLGFSTLETLVEGCGPAQPWVAVPVDRLEGLLGLTGSDVVLWDGALSADQRHEVGGEAGR